MSEEPETTEQAESEATEQLEHYRKAFRALVDRDRAKRAAESGRNHHHVCACHRTVDRILDNLRQNGTTLTWTGDDIEDMGLAEYDIWFDARGCPRPGVRFHVSRTALLEDRRSA